MNMKSITKRIGDQQSMFKDAKDGGPRKPMKISRCDNTLVLSGGKTDTETPHDLHRIDATMIQALRVPLDAIDRCQNRVLDSSKVRQHYLHHGYADEKRDARQRLG